MPPRVFTSQEASAALGEVRSLVELLVDHRAAQLAARARLAELRVAMAGNGHGPLRDAAIGCLGEAREAEAGIGEALAALDELGVVVKDVDAGLVDFPSVREGREVFLCWQLGEEDVGFWHGVDEGFRGRRPL